MFFNEQGKYWRWKDLQMSQMYYIIIISQSFYQGYLIFRTTVKLYFTKNTLVVDVLMFSLRKHNISFRRIRYKSEMNTFCIKRVWNYWYLQSRASFINKFKFKFFFFFVIQYWYCILKDFCENRVFKKKSNEFTYLNEIRTRHIISRLLSRNTRTM